MKTLTRTLALGAVLWALPAAAAEHPERLMLLMNLIDQVPNKAQLVEAGAGPHGAALLAIAKDRDLPRYPRMRAAGSLGLFEGAQAKAALAALLDDPRIRDREVKIQALAALVHLEEASAFDRLARLARDPDPELRAAAVRNLRRIEHPDAPAFLRARLAPDGERVPWVRDLVRGALP